MAPPSTIPVPGVDHGERILAAVVEERAKNNSSSPWLSIPVDENNLSLGFRDITFKQLNNYANHAAQWLIKALPNSEEFQRLAYSGPKDLRYPILAIAAAKVQKVMVLPSPLVTAKAQLNIFEKTGCTLYLRPQESAASVAEILKDAPHIHTITVPALGEFFNEIEAIPVNYSKSWEEGKDDPWLVFHTSGTTGNPKPITYTHEMMAGVDAAASRSDIEECVIHQFAQQRWYSPLPSLHFVGMAMTLAMTTFLHMTAVLGPSTPPSPEVITNVLRYGNVKGALLPPILIDSLCLSPAGLQALRELKYIHFAGAPLSAKSGELLVPYTKVVPAIGSTETGGYFTACHDKADAWDFVTFQKHAGAIFEPRVNNLHELVFIRDPSCSMQQIFTVYPDRDRFETNDLWIEHPDYKGLWKIIGRTDDYVCLSHGEGLHASLLEPEIKAHPSVKNALIGGQGRPQPVLLVELIGSAEQNGSPGDFIESLRPYIEKVNSSCHEAVQISLDKIIIASKEKPFIETIKGSVARLQTLALYEEEIAAHFF
ncbi:hypothetical protein N7462_010032 [Penicillium macrosclerotiorum]|uniref:uncharacterized protein n=1 Tax=Penicillium macrosclerotiorum TaxID=303699 RepID=UPI002548E48F|nr:uncharacterized protein N7462_010032 [Penicillium macrosclerotiorum]KAJ5668962.1 hypothetical protein N7462_010032 [Penicillium macrosclerotiorum]